MTRWLAAALLCGFLHAAHGQTLPEGRIFELPGVKLYVRDGGGSGMPLILLHANTGTSAVWDRQFADFSAAGYRVISFDRRGWGGSIADPATGPQPGSIAGDLDALAGALHLDRFDLLGVAGGGFAALDYLGWHPERVHRAVVAASSGLLSAPEFVAFAKRIDIPALDKGPASDLELSSGYRGSDPDGVLRWSAIQAKSQQPGAPSQPLHTPNTLAKIGGITTPVLVVAADADLLAPPAFIRMWADHLPNHEYVTVEAAGHSVAWEQPAVFDRIVLDFLRKPNGPGNGVRP